MARLDSASVPSPSLSAASFGRWLGCTQHAGRAVRQVEHASVHRDLERPRDEASDEPIHHAGVYRKIVLEARSLRFDDAKQLLCSLLRSLEQGRVSVFDAEGRVVLEERLIEGTPFRRHVI